MEHDPTESHKLGSLGPRALLQSPFRRRASEETRSVGFHNSGYLIGVLIQRESYYLGSRLGVPPYFRKPPCEKAALDAPDRQEADTRNPTRPRWQRSAHNAADMPGGQKKCYGIVGSGLGVFVTRASS